MFGANKELKRLEEELIFLRNRVNQHELRIWELENPCLYKNGEKVKYIPKGKVLCIEITVLESKIENACLNYFKSPFIRMYTCITDKFKVINNISESELFT